MIIGVSWGLMLLCTCSTYMSLYSCLLAYDNVLNPPQVQSDHNYLRKNRLPILALIPLVSSNPACFIFWDVVLTSDVAIGMFAQCIEAPPHNHSPATHHGMLLFSL